jgi:hypothetical protein
MMDAVHRYEGYVAQSLGDGIFALFGAPIAHEDHAQRALYAALRMQEAMRRYADSVRLARGVPLQIRVGLNTGEVVVCSIRADDLHTDYVPIGHVTSLAARLQSLANPGSIVVSASTFRLTDGFFAFNALGAAQIKGVSEPVPVYEVVSVGPLRTRLHVAARRGLARFVGRQPELELMQQAWEQAQRGQGQGAGDAGQEPGALVGSGAVSAQGRTAVAARGSTARGGGSLLPPGPRHRPPSANKIAGTARRDEPEPAVAAPGQARGSTAAAGGDLRLVYRGV